MTEMTHMLLNPIRARSESKMRKSVTCVMCVIADSSCGKRHAEINVAQLAILARISPEGNADD
jgi:hypothetical protein